MEEVIDWSDWEEQLQEKRTELHRQQEISAEWMRGPLFSWVEYAKVSLAGGYADWKEVG